MNPGYLKVEIDKLKEECKSENANYVLVQDELNLDESGEYAQFQFVGEKDEQEVIYDVVLMTTRLLHSSLLLARAEQIVQKQFPDFIPLEEREEGYVAILEADEKVQSLLEELEEEESITVPEHLIEDVNYDFGIGLEVALHVDEINEVIISDFISKFQTGRWRVDNTEKSFKHYEEEE